MAGFLYCETNENGSFDTAYKAEIFNTETFTSFDSKLDPDNVFGSYSGLTGELKYYLDFNAKSEEFAFRASDIGLLLDVTNGKFTNRVTEDYISCHPGTFFLDAGKKKITQSVSFLVSPIDFLLYGDNDISKNQTYNLQFKEGKYMANMDWYSDFGIFGLCYVPRIDFTNDAVAYFSRQQAEEEEFRYNITLSGADAGLALNYDTNWSAGADVSLTIGDYIEVHAEGAYTRNAARAGFGTNMIMTGFDPSRMQYIYSGFLTNTREILTNVYRIVLGGAYNGEYFSIMTEYYYNTAGYDTIQWNGIRNSIKDFRHNYDNDQGGVLSVPNLGILSQFMTNFNVLDFCRDYAMIRVSNPPSQNIGLAWITLINLDDLSGMEIFTASCSGWDNLTLTCEFAFNFGDDYSEIKLLGQDWSAGLEVDLSF